MQQINKRTFQNTLKTLTQLQEKVTELQKKINEVDSKLSDVTKAKPSNSFLRDRSQPEAPSEQG